ncbi:MAG: sulfite oxidase [Cyclobacteriaceae bacterium]
MSAVLGGNIVFAENMPAGIIPAGLLDNDDPFPLEGKNSELIILNDKPWNVETPAHLLDPRLTPKGVFFVRNNGHMPENIDVNSWTLTIDGEGVSQPKTYTLQELKSKFEKVSYELVLECGGNGRSEFYPQAKGNQWNVGAVGCAKWTGVRLRDVLNDVGIKSNAEYIGYYGKDVHLSGNPDKVVISRGVPLDKAMQPESLIAWAMNDEDIPIYHGYPLRLVFGGWPASTSGKWLSRIAVRDQVHDGPKMESPSYRMPCKPVAPGEVVKDEDMCIMQTMPVKSVITHPKSGAVVKPGQSFEARGHAWAGELDVSEMHVSFDFGSTWQKCELTRPVNRMAWQQWKANLQFPQEGYYEIWARATDSEGRMQPMVLPGWNPKGYLNNACHRIAMKASS